MRDREKVEVAQISEAVTRDMLARTNVLWSIEREVHARLPGTIQRHAQALLPDLARVAVTDATPDLREAQAKVEDTLREKLRSDLSGMVERAADGRLPELARDAVQQATPDTEVVRTELVRAAGTELTGLLREHTERVLTDVVARAAERVRGELGELLAAEAKRLLPELAESAIADATPDRTELRAELVRDASGAVTEAVRESSREAVPELVRTVSAAAMDTVRDAVRAEAEEVFAKYAPNLVTVVLPDGERVELDTDTHEVLPELLIALHARCHVLLVGPAGTGKSMLAKHAADALGVPFQALSLGPTTPMSKVFGYFDAHGNYHDTPFRRAFEDGGVMLLDELDNGHPGLLAELNQALALGTCAFADRMVQAHENFRLVATGNTYGTGGDRQYVGRQSLDSATLDRFVVLDVPIDEGLEERIALRHAPDHADEVHKLLAKVRELRAKAATKKLPVLFSPRASIDGAKLLQAGASVAQVIRWRVLRGISEAHRKSLDLG